MSEKFTFEIRVYYEDTDFSTNVYHGSYVKFFERARTEWLRHFGIHHFELAEQGLAFAVRKMEIDFLKSAHIDDLLQVSTKITSLSAVRISLEQEIYCGAEKIASAQVMVVMINANGKATRLPKAIKSVLST